MRHEVEKTLREVAEAVNQAPPGHLITGSEEKVRDLMGDLRRRIYETAVQMRVEEGERSFSPSPGCGERPPDAQ